MAIDEKDVLKIGMDAAVKPFANLLERLFGGAVDQIGGGWEDRLKARRYVRLVKLYAKIQDRLDEAGIDPHEIPEKIWVPALQAASLEDAETLQDKWACLLANAASPAATVHPAFVEILNAMAPLDAVVLDETYKCLLLEMKSKGNFQIVFLENKAMQEVLKKAFQNGADASLENLTRLRLVEAVPEWLDESSVRSRPVHRYYITRLGHDFYLACQPPKLQESLRGQAPFGGL